MSSNRTPLLPGDIVASRYRVERVLGIGAMGAVVAAVDLNSGVRVAIKHLLREHEGDATLRRRFMRESYVASSMRSEHAVRVLRTGMLTFTDERASDAGDGARLPYMVMEHLEGSNLDSLLRQRGPLPASEAADYVVQACSALIEAHSLGLVHRDIKPANLFLTQRADGRELVKVLDFGVAKLRSQGICLTDEGAILGTLAYVAPEQIGDSAGVDARADIWSLGVTLYRLVTGALPFKGSTFVEVVLSIAKDLPQPMQALCADLPAGFDAVVQRCLQKAPEDRYQSAMELAQALTPYVPRARIPGKDDAPPTITVTREEVSRALQMWARAGRERHA